MNKKLLSLALALSMLTAFMSIISSAETGTKYGDYLYYEINEDGTAITITDCDQSSTVVEIPSEINSLPVTSIGRYAFWNCGKLTSITIPDGITSIDYGAFSGCRNLTSVAIGNGVASIGKRAFYWCNSLESINISSENKSYCLIDGNLFDIDKKTLIQYAIGKTNTSYTIPDGVTSIVDSAFAGCMNLESIIIPEGVTSIGNSVFDSCYGLTNITIPNSVTSIGFEAFSGCDKLTDVYYNSTEEQWKAIEIDKEHTSAVKAFIWNATSSMMPASRPQSIEL